MNHNLNQPLKEILASQLVFMDENGTDLIDSYFSSDRSKYHKFHKEYTSEVQSFLSNFDDQTERIPLVPKVFIGSKVLVMFEDDNETEDFTICFPEHSDPDKGYISFLSPVGSQLLLRSSGEKMILTTPGGEFEVTIKEIHLIDYQNAKFIP